MGGQGAKDNTRFAGPEPATAGQSGCWIFALGAIAAFRPADLPAVLGGLLVAATMTAIVILAAALWAAAGGWLGRVLNGERSRRVVSLGLAALLAASVAAIWR